MTVPTVPPPATPSTAKTAMTPSTAAPRLKLVIRRLPPTLPEEIFWNSVTPWLGNVTGNAEGESKINWKRYVKGKAVSDTNQHRVFSRAYVQMKTTEDLTLFAQAYDGHVFRGKDGQEFQAVVEFAPAQKIPTFKSKPRVDARQDADFLSFLESLKAPIVKQDINHSERKSLVMSTSAIAEKLIHVWSHLDCVHPAIAAPEQPKSTPLLDHLRETRMAKKGSNAGRSSAADGRSGGKDKAKGRDTGKDDHHGKSSKHKDGSPKPGGAAGKKDGHVKSTGGKQRDAPQSLAANRDPVKIQVNPARQSGAASGKVQILQRAAAPAGSKPAPGQTAASTSAVPTPLKGPKPPQNARSKAPSSAPGDQDPIGPASGTKASRGKGKDASAGGRQRPERGAKSLLSAALNASTTQQQQGGSSGPGKGNRGPKVPLASATKGSTETGQAGPDAQGKKDGDEADKKKRTRTRGGQGKKKGETGSDAGGPGVDVKPGGTARIDD